MKVNYVLMYGTPYLKYREFETFEDISKFIVNKSIVNYSIFKKLEDKEEVEMIYRDNDIRVLENRIQKAIELLELTEARKTICKDFVNVGRKRYDEILNILKGGEENVER